MEIILIKLRVKFIRKFDMYFRRKYHAGVMLTGTGEIYLTPKTQSKKNKNIFILY
jgi:hypothetical protein